MTKRIRHNYPSLIRCLRVFCCYCYNHYKIPKTLILLSLLLLPLPPLSYYFATKHLAADTKFPGVVELTTQLLIFENILCLPLCRIDKFGLNTLPSKVVAIPYTCGLSGAPPPKPNPNWEGARAPFPSLLLPLPSLSYSN